MSLKDFYNNFNKFKPPILIFEGNDNFLKKQIFKFLKKNLKDYSFQNFSIDDTNILKVIDQFKSPTLFGEKFIISFGLIDKLQKNEKQEIIKIIEEKERYKNKNILILFFKKLPKNDKLISVGEKEKCFFRLIPPSELQLKSYIKKFFISNNIKIDENVPEFIIENLSNNLEAISNELYKIINSNIKNNILTVEEIKRIISPVREENIYKFIDTIIGKQKKDALEMFNKLIELNTNIESIINLFLSTINNMILIKTGKLINKPDNEIITKFKIHPYAFKINLFKSKKISIAELYSLLFEVLKIQVDIRKKGINAKQALLRFLLKI